MGSGFSINIESCKAKFIKIKYHQNGRQVSYGYQMLFDGQPPYPKLIIIHRIPNQEFNKVSITAKLCAISKLEGETSSIIPLLGEKKHQLNIRKSRLSEAKRILEQKKKNR